eukprot:scaffold5944_cov102-Skeletonema_marinoi.AAC.4
MEEQQLDPLINAAVLAGDVHQIMHMQQQPQNNGLPELPQPATAPPLHRHHHHAQQAAPPPQMVVHNVVHTTMYPPPALGGQPLQSHPTLPQLQQQQQQQIATTAAPPRKKSDHTNYNHQSQSSANTITLNHPQNETYKLKTNQYLLETSSRLDDAVSELYHYTSLLSNHHKKPSTVECITNMEQSIIPLLKICSNAMKDAGKYFAPFSGTVNIHNRNDAEKKRRLVLEEENKAQMLLQQNEVVGGGGNKRRGKKKRPALLMIDEFVERSKLIVSKNTVVDQDNNSTMTTAAAVDDNEQQQQELVGGSLQQQPPTTRKRKAPTKKSTTTESIIILQPKNGTVYTKSEAIAICKRYRKGSRERGLAIRAMVHEKFVLASRKTLYRLLQQDEEGRVLLENGWLGCGRPMKVDLSLDIGGSGVVPKGQMLVNSSLTFEELDRGEENRILVELKKGGGNEGEDEEEEDDLSDSNDKQSKKRKKKHSIPPPKKGICSASGCTNQIARRGLCVKHGMQVVDSKITSFPLPPPRDGGTVYKKSECVEIAKQYKKGSSQRRLALESMIYRGYAKNSLKSLYRLLLNDEKGIPIVDDDWRGMGCPSVLSAKEIDGVIERIQREDIRLSSDDDVRQLVLDALKAKGVTDESKLKFSATTVKNYGAIFKSKLSTVYWKNDIESQQQGLV